MKAIGEVFNMMWHFVTVCFVTGDWRQTASAEPQPSLASSSRSQVVSIPLPRALTGNMPWATQPGKPGVALAGGAVASMIAPGTKPSDYDLFLVVPSQVKIVRGQSMKCLLLWLQ